MANIKIFELQSNDQIEKNQIEELSDEDLVVVVGGGPFDGLPLVGGLLGGLLGGGSGGLPGGLPKLPV